MTPRLSTALNANQLRSHPTLIEDLFDRGKFDTFSTELDLNLQCTHERSRLGQGYLKSVKQLVEWGYDRSLSFRGAALMPFRRDHLPYWLGGTGGKHWGRPKALTTIEKREKLRFCIQSPIEEFRHRVTDWAIAHEAFDCDGYVRSTPWGYGEQLLARAYGYAKEVNPDVRLFYDDYLVPSRADYDGLKKWRSIFGAIEQINREGRKIDGIGIQVHQPATTPLLPLLLDLSWIITQADRLDLVVQFSEVQIYLLEEVGWQKLRQQQLYKQLWQVARSRDVELFSVWGLCDRWEYLDWTRGGLGAGMFDLRGDRRFGLS